MKDRRMEGKRDWGEGGLMKSETVVHSRQTLPRDGLKLCSRTCRRCTTAANSTSRSCGSTTSKH